MIGVSGTINGLYSVSHNPYADGWISVSPNGFIHNPNSTTAFSGAVLQTTPEIFEQVIYGYEGRIWARSSTSIYTTTDMGISWNKIYTGLISGMGLSDGMTTLYLLLNNGDIVRQNRIMHPPLNLVSGPYNELDTTIIRFNTFGSTITGNPLVVTPGIYLFTYGFKMGSTDVLGNCVNKNLLWGVTMDDVAPEQAFNYFSRTESYSINSADQSTWQTFSNSIVLVLTTYTTFRMDVKLLNLPVGGTTDAYIYDRVANLYVIGNV